MGVSRNRKTSANDNLWGRPSDLSRLPEVVSGYATDRLKRAESLFPAVTLRFPLRLDNYSKSQFKSTGAKMFGRAQTHCSAFLKQQRVTGLYTTFHGAASTH